MDYEKKYKEALERAKEIHNEHKAQPFNIMTKVFPELAESEDEKIRKFLIEDIKDTLSSEGFRNYNPEHTDKLKEALAWLEKQGEHHIACSEEQMKVLDEVLNFAANHESSYWNDYIFETLNNLIRQLKN